MPFHEHTESDVVFRSDFRPQPRVLGPTHLGASVRVTGGPIGALNRAFRWDSAGDPEAVLSGVVGLETIFRASDGRLFRHMSAIAARDFWPDNATPIFADWPGFVCRLSLRGARVAKCEEYHYTDTTGNEYFGFAKDPLIDLELDFSRSKVIGRLSWRLGFPTDWPRGPLASVYRELALDELLFRAILPRYTPLRDRPTQTAVLYIEPVTDIDSAPADLPVSDIHVSSTAAP